MKIVLHVVLPVLFRVVEAEDRMLRVRKEGCLIILQLAVLSLHFGLVLNIPVPPLHRVRGSIHC